MMSEKAKMLVDRLQQGSLSVKEMSRIKHELHEMFKSVIKQALRDAKREQGLSAIDPFILKIWAEKAWFQALRHYSVEHGNVYEYVYQQIMQSMRKALSESFQG